MSGELILLIITKALFFTCAVCLTMEMLTSKTYPDDPDGQQDKEAHGGST